MSQQARHGAEGRERTGRGGGQNRTGTGQFQELTALADGTVDQLAEALALRVVCRGGFKEDTVPASACRRDRKPRVIAPTTSAPAQARRTLRKLCAGVAWDSHGFDLTMRIAVSSGSRQETSGLKRRRRRDK